MSRRNSNQLQATQHLTQVPRVAMAPVGVGMRNSAAWTLVAREATQGCRVGHQGAPTGLITDAVSAGVCTFATVAVGRCLQTPNESLQTPHEALLCACAGGVAACAGSPSADYRFPAGDTAVSAGMYAHALHSHAVSTRLQGLVSRETSDSPRAKGHMRPESAVVARDTGDVPGLYPVSPRPSLVGRACVLAEGGCDQCFLARDWCRPECMQCRHVCADTNEKQNRTRGACNSAFVAMNPLFVAPLRSDARIAASCGTISPDHEASAWERRARRCHLMAFGLVRRLAHARRADLWLAHGGPQTGHELAQACPSKHPDGYRETLFRRRSI